MANLQDLINLAKADGGKFFVMDESGEAHLVIMSVEDYERLLLGKLQRQVKQQSEDIERVNKMITSAQLQETPVSPAPETPKPPVQQPTVRYHQTIARPDLRAEVIDPSFDFEGPKMEIEDL